MTTSGCKRAWEIDNLAFQGIVSTSYMNSQQDIYHFTQPKNFQASVEHNNYPYTRPLLSTVKYILIMKQRKHPIKKNKNLDPRVTMVQKRNLNYHNLEPCLASVSLRFFFLIIRKARELSSYTDVKKGKYLSVALGQNTIK